MVRGTCGCSGFATYQVRRSSTSAPARLSGSLRKSRTCQRRGSKSKAAPPCFQLSRQQGQERAAASHHRDRRPNRSSKPQGVEVGTAPHAIAHMSESILVARFVVGLARSRNFGGPSTQNGGCHCRFVALLRRFVSSALTSSLHRSGTRSPHAAQQLLSTGLLAEPAALQSDGTRTEHGAKCITKAGAQVCFWNLCPGSSCHGEPSNPPLNDGRL